VTTQYLLFVLAAVCLILAAFGVALGRVSLFPLGMALWLAAERL
jgi:hypothetical protein